MAATPALACEGAHPRVEPDHGPMRSAGRVRIHGAGFVGHGAPAVYFGDAHALAVVVYSDRVIGALPPEVDAPGTVTVRVVFDDGAEVRLPEAYTYDRRVPVLDLRAGSGE